MRFKDLRIKTKLTYLFLLVGVLPLLIITNFFLGRLENFLIKESFSKLNAIEKIKKEEIYTFFSTIEENITIFSKMAFIREAVEKLNTQDSVKFAQKNREFLTIYQKNYRLLDIFIFPGFNKSCQFINHPGITLRQNPEFIILRERFLKNKSIVFSDLLKNSPNEQSPAIIVLAPVFDSKNDFIGGVGFRISHDVINTIIQKRDGMGKTSETYLVGKDFKMRSNSYLDPVDHSVEASFRGNIDANGVKTRASIEALQKRSGEEIITDYRGIKVLSSYDFIVFDKNKWAIISEIDLSEVSEPINKLNSLIILITFMVSIILIYISLWAASNISEPITAITSIAANIAKGDFKDQITIDSKDEVGMLVLAFKQVKKTIIAISTEIEKLIEATKSEDFEATANLENFSGKWRTSIEYINNLVEIRNEAEKRRNAAFDLMEKTLRYATVGGLTSGIAHEINQPLNALKITIDGILYNLKKQYFFSEEQLMRKYQFISDQCEKMAQIILNMRSLASQNNQIRNDQCNLNLAITNSVSILQEQLKYNNIKLITTLSPKIKKITIGQTFLEQIIINLLNNAKDSLKKDPTIKEKQIGIESELVNDQILSLVVWDNGPGFKEEIKESVFEPFTSTGSNCNMGLGLFIVDNIVKTFKGTIRIESSPGSLTKIIIHLPYLKDNYENSDS